MAQLCTHSLALQEGTVQGNEGGNGRGRGYIECLFSLSAGEKQVQKLQSSPAASPCDSTHLPRLPSVPSNLKPVDEAVRSQEPYVPVSVVDFAPLDRRQRYRYV